jgi:L-ascorbate metabolism protein UlaG (beta-lactamase superfamily)
VKLTRRKLVAGGAAVALGAALFEEKRKLSGAWDNTEPVPATAAERWIASLKELDGDPAKAAGSVVHVGQSTHLLSIAGKRLLTDPWFFDPAFGAQSHAAGPAVAPEGVGKLDFVLVTHDHPDHADPMALDRLDKRAQAIVSTKELLERVKKQGYASPVLLEPWQSFSAGELTITAVPGLHDVYEVGYVIQAAGRSVYFAGDSRLHPDLPAIAERFSPTTAIVSVDGTRLIGSKDLWVMNPEDAVTACSILKVKAAMPSHADAYFSDHLVRWGRLATTVADANAKFEKKLAASLPEVRCLRPAPGETAEL